MIHFLTKKKIFSKKVSFFISHFLSLLVSDFYHPTNGDLYLVGGMGGMGGVGRIFGSNFNFFQCCLEVV